jgi:hypothetical protein
LSTLPFKIGSANAHAKPEAQQGNIRKVADMKYPCVFDYADRCHKGDGQTENGGHCSLTLTWHCPGYKPLRVRQNSILIKQLAEKRKKIAAQEKKLMAENLKILAEIAETQK